MLTGEFTGGSLHTKCTDFAVITNELQPCIVAEVAVTHENESLLFAECGNMLNEFAVPEYCLGWKFDTDQERLTSKFYIMK